MDGKYNEGQRLKLSGLDRQKKMGKKGGKEMRKGILLGLALVLMVLGTAVDSRAQGGPVLEKIWAPAEVDYGKLLKVYIKASDPEGDMRWVTVAGGRGEKPTGAVPIRISKEARKDLNGFVYWDTRKAASHNTSGTVFITIEDWKGNESETKSVAVKIVPKGAKAEKPPADFQEKEIGPIMMDTLQRPY
jgi:hypothetical protein